MEQSKQMNNTLGPDTSSPGKTKPLGQKISRIAEYAIKFSLFSFSFFSPVSISAAQISLGIGILGWVVYLSCTPKEQKDPFFVSPIGRAYFLFLFAGLLSVIFAEEKLAALSSLRSLWVFVAFFLAANWIKHWNDLKICLAIIIIVSSLGSLFGIIQHLSGIKILGHQLIAYKSRATGLFGGSMTFAGLMLVVSLLAIPVFFPRNLQMKNLAWIFPLGLITVALLFSLQRGAWLGFIGGILLMGALRGKKVFLLVILLLSIGITTVYLTQPHVRNRAATSFKIDTKLPINSLSERLLLWRTALTIAREHPIAGTGLDQFRKYAGEIISSQIPDGNFRVTLCHAHSNPLQILATTGIIGFLAFLWLWVMVFREGLRMLHWVSPSHSLYIIGVLSAVCAFHVEGLFEYTFGDSEIITLTWFLVGGMMALGRLEDGKGASGTTQND